MNSQRCLRLSFLFSWALVLLALCVVTPTSIASAGDINRDGFGDLVVGAPGFDISGITEVGSIFAIFGTSAGLNQVDSQWWTPAQPPISGSEGEDEYFGSALALGDFNGDGFKDAAIGIPGEDYDFHGAESAGAVHVLYGYSSGLGPVDQQVIQQGVDGLEESAEDGDQFGSALASGDFNADGFWDLAVGAPFEDTGTVQSTGCVIVVFGSASGLDTNSSQLLSQMTPNMPGTPEENDRFGNALTAGDFNGDGNSDLAVGVNFEDIGTVVGAGAVHVLYGSVNGLVAAGSQFWSQDTSGVLDTSETDDHFGSSLAAGFFDDDGYQDLAVGIPGEDHAGMSGAGAIAVFYGSSGGVSTTRDEFWLQGDTGSGATEAGDYFGRALAVGDFDGDDYCDLAIGASGEAVVTTDGAGAVTIIYGSVVGLLSSGSQLWYQGLNGLLENPEADDGFGYALAAGDFDGDGWADLAVGVPFEDHYGRVDLGLVHALYGSSTGITATGNQLWSEVGIYAEPEPWDFFGIAVASVSMPPRIFFDGFETGDKSAW